MFKFIGFIVVSLLLSSCVEEERIIKGSSLLVEKITTDTNEAALIKQINIKFNQDIAIVGAIPNNDQIDSISMSHDLKTQCQWRFIQLNTLSCDLKTRLTLMTDYHITVESTFTALSKPLHQAVNKTITTSIPSLNLQQISTDDDFFIDHVIGNFKDIDISISALQDFLMLKSPSGNFYSVLIVKDKIYNRDRVKLTIKGLPEIKEDGRYEFILPVGFQASKNQKILTQEHILHSFRYSSQLTFYGLYCYEYGPKGTLQAITVNKQGVLPCAPERISLAFSSGFEQMRMPRQISDWIIGGKSSIQTVRNRDDFMHLWLEFDGDTEYKIDLTKLKNNQGKIKNPQTITFKTQQSTPLWGRSDFNETVIESQYQALPQFLRRNVSQLIQETTPINTSHELLSFLNDESSLVTMTEDLIELEKAKYTLTKQPIPFRQKLASQSGLAHIKLTGNSNTPIRQYKGVISKSDSFLTNSAAFNIAVWHQKDLMIQLIDWDGIFVESANISLICEGSESPLLLGMTEANGMLWIKDQEWQKIYNEFKENKNECWLWADKLAQTAAIEIPAVDFNLSDSIKAMAWSTQPIYQRGELVEIGFIARIRTQQGLMPLTSLANYHLEITDPNRKSSVVKLSALSNMGFAKSSYHLTGDMPQGIYRFKLVDDVFDNSHFIGHFIVTKFVAPEFEHNLKAPSKLFINKPIEISIQAKRMNGVALTGAKANINFNIRQKHSGLRNWPKNYDFNSWESFKKNKNNLEKGKVLNQLLDTQGRLMVNLQDYQSTVPYGVMTIESEIIADDGSTQTSSIQRPYFSRKHYIGTKYNQEKQQLEIIAIDYQGNEINEVNVSVNITIPSSKEKTVTQITSCEFNILPAYCKVKDREYPLTVNITSGDDDYQWYRRIDNKQTDEMNISDVKNKLELVLTDKKIISGEEFNLTLMSPFSGIATFIINGDTIKKTWQQPVSKGVNVIKLKADKSWLPSVRLFASLSVSRDMANAAIKQQLSILNNADELKPDVRKHKIYDLGSQRLLTDNIVIYSSQSIIPSQVKLTVSSNSVLAGEKINVTVKSTQDSQAQLWLVNDALLTLSNKQVNEYDFNGIIKGHSYNDNQMSYDALSDHLGRDALLGIDSLDLDSDGYQSFRIEADTGIDFGIGGVSVGSSRMKPPPPPEFNPNDEYQLSHSRLLSLVDLKKGESQDISVKLPQLIGRWKVIALTATNQTASISALDIVTTRPVEYFIDAPNHVYSKDVSQFAITAINQSDKELTDTLTLWDGDTALTTLNVHLQAKKQERLVIELPMLSVGEHTLRLTSNKDANYINYHNISVKSALFNYHKKWLMNASQKGIVAKPKDAIKDSVKLSYQTLNNTSPDWQALAIYNKDYPHQCWEQTISRALTFSVNPQADDIWPNGIDQLQSLINENNQKTYFSYFKNTKIDPFLTAYTYLINSWLDSNKFNINVDKKDIKEWLVNLILEQEISSPATNQERSMALLVLAVQNDITLDEALIYRQRIGLADPFSSVLQSLALKELGADKGLYQTQLLEFNDATYQDDSTNLFNQTSHQCFAALVYDENSIEREQLTARVIEKQQELGHFGSTFANGVCSYLLKGNKKMSQSINHELDYVVHENSLNYTIKDSPAHWLTLTYQASLSDITEENNGINITRERLVRMNDEWQPLLNTSTLKVGDIVKTVLSVNSPIKREHIAVTDSVAGGLEVISPFLQNAFYHQDRDYGWSGQNHIEINEGEVKWYIINLPKDGQKYSYYSRVRHQGSFLTGPASAQAMYRSDINARTTSSVITID